MKRSDINRFLEEADEFINAYGFKLPPLAYWLPKEMQARQNDTSRIISAGMLLNPKILSTVAERRGH